MKVLKWMDDNLESYLSFLFYFYLTMVIFIEVVRRYIFNSSSTWGEETAIYAFIWMTYIAAAKGVKERTHLSVDVLVRLMGRRGKLFSLILSDVCFFILAATIFYYSLSPIGMNIEYGQTMMGVNLPMALATVAVPFGWLLIMVRVIQRFIKTIKTYRKGDLPIEESTISM